MEKAERLAKLRHEKHHPNIPWGISGPVYRKEEIERAKAALALQEKAETAMADYEH